MTTKEAVDTAEDVIEAVVDSTRSIFEEHMDLFGKVATGAVLIGFAGGAVAGYLFAQKRLKPKYEQIAKEEIEEAKQFYSRVYKHEDFETPGLAAEKLGVDVDAAVRAMREYQAISEIADMEEEEELVETPVSTKRNIFAENVPADSVWDLEEELKNRTDDEPYIISQDEYEENERDYQQLTLSYFEEDDVLVDEAEKPIEEVDSVVGEGNLTRFGHGSNDNRIVYIRNDRLSMDFEIVKNQGSYAKDVLGFQHADEVGRKAQLRKFRVSDE